MNGDIVPYAHREAPERPSWAKRQKRREEYDRVRRAFTELDEKCRELVADDPALNALLTEAKLDVMLRLGRVRHPRRFRNADFSICG